MCESPSAKQYVGAVCHEFKPGDEQGLRALVVTGDEISSFSLEDWDMAAGNYNEIVFMRTTPEQKLKMVEEMKLRGDNIVAVTSIITSFFKPPIGSLIAAMVSTFGRFAQMLCEATV
jgi:sodium/potassium-transporting ATPase subunit alpha